ncbi:MAG: aminotransferase class III-fold pyridoxal phosphate-dependent enzyme [Actinomycetes bacterium]
MGAKLWHPFADMSTVQDNELVIESGDGAYVTDESGRRYLDATAGLWYCNIGHGRQELADAAAAQIAKIAAYSTFGNFATRPTLELAERIADIAPMDDAVVFFTSGGSDSVDTAVKMVQRYWGLQGQPNRNLIITRNKAYHGMHMAGTSLAGIEANRTGFTSLLDSVMRVAWDDADDLITELDRLGPDRVAAFFCEPIIGAGGVFAPPPGYLEKVRDACRERGVLFVADEVISGYGRTGHWFASDRWTLDPDLILSAKGLTSGYLPMGAVLVSGAVAEPFWTRGGVFRHGYTYSGHATAAAVALANLDVLARENLVRRVLDLEPVLEMALRPLIGSDLVSQVRAGVGLLAAVQLAPDAVAADVTLAPRVIAGLRDRGVLTRLLADTSIQVSPPFVVTGSDLALLATAIAETLADVGSPVVKPANIGNVDLLPEQTSDDTEAGWGSGEANTDEWYRMNRPPHHGG